MNNMKLKNTVLKNKEVQRGVLKAVAVMILMCGAQVAFGNSAHEIRAALDEVKSEGSLIVTSIIGISFLFAAAAFALSNHVGRDRLNAAITSLVVFVFSGSIIGFLLSFRVE